MQSRMKNLGAWLCGAAFVFALVVMQGDVRAQTSTQSETTRRQSRRVTNPVRGQRPPLPPEEDLRIVSTAEETQADETQTEDAAPPRNNRNRRAPSNNATSEQALRRTVEQLNQQVTRLSAELNDMRGQQRTLVTLERLSRAEQRVESYRAQLRDVVQREANLQARLDQIEIEILPENIEARAAGTGSLRAEQVREQMRRLLENERTRGQSQLNLLTQNRAQLEAAIARADVEVARLSESVNETPQTDVPPAPPATTDTTTTDTTQTDTDPVDTAPPPQSYSFPK